MNETTFFDVEEWFHYNPDTGVVTRKKHAGPNAYAGSVAGYKTPKQGYLLVKHKFRCFLAHRIAWRLHYGEWPPRGVFIDHINCDGSDNRIENLRLATRAENARNARRSKRNKSGVKGVHARFGKFIAEITVDRKKTYLGMFDSIEEAAIARARAAKEMHGEFARAA